MGSSTLETVVFVDDDGDASLSLIKALKGYGLIARCDAYTNAASAIQALDKNKIVQVAVLDLSLEPMRGVESGFELLREFLSKSPDTRAIVLTGHGNDEFGIRALQMGAASFLEKPVSPSHLAAIISDGIAQSNLRRRVRDLELSSGHEQVPGLIGESDAMKTLRNELDFLASNSLSVFLRGETGVGKSYFAYCLHQLAHERRTLSGNFVSYAPRAGGSDLVSSDLFGHVKGAFTGATENKSGLLHHAKDGTLFLDEIDELPPEVQVTLLTVLQERKYRAVGSSRDEPFNGRIIAASNADYIESQKSSKLRSDLFHRIAQEVVIIPPLRERRDDIAVLATEFLSALKRREPMAVSGFQEETMRALQSYDWPGNVRELEKAVERGAARAAYERQVSIRLIDLPPQIFADTKAGISNTSQLSFAERVEQYKQQLISDALNKCDGNQLKAAELLVLDRSSMRRIYSRLKG